MPPPDRLLGDLFTTTTRNQLSADTGLGKTMFGLATAFAMRTASSLLGWRAYREARVLIIDGEMPPELIKERMAAAASWFGVGEPISDGLFLLSREDVEDMPPLDTEDGARWLLGFMAGLGRIDHVTLDNIGALTSGCLKEEESDRVLKDLRREITKLNTGQLWLHHTGLDATRGYGGKVREWNLDTVMVGEKLDRPEADAAFTLKFTKTRRRTPANRADFENREVILCEGRWEHAAACSDAQKKRLGPNEQLVFDALLAAIADRAEPPPTAADIPHNATGVSVARWQATAMRYLPHPEVKRKNEAFQRAMVSLVGSRSVLHAAGFAWLP